LAYADRDRFVADSDFVALPPGLLAPGYLAARAALIGERSIGTAPAGRPTAMGAPARSSEGGALLPPGGARASRAETAPFTYPEGGTSHVSVVDGEGNAVALTTSIEFAFGSQQMVGGFLL